MMTPTGMEAMSQNVAIRLVDCAIEGTLIAVVCGLVLRLSRRQSSGTRFTLWFSSLIAIAAVPVFSGWQWTSTPGSAPGHAAITLPDSWAVHLSIAWGLIAGIALLRVASGLWHVHALRKSCVLIDPSQLDGSVLATLKSGAGQRRVSFCWSERVQVPTALGLLRPAIVVPRWVLEEFSADELNQVLLHELAHLTRWDDWTNLAQKIVKALLFFHPAVWWIEREISLEREMACDDAVLAATERPRAYAECLAHLAERTLIRRTLALAQAALGRVRQTSLRVAQILDGDRPRAGKSSRLPAAVLAGCVIACAVFVTREPRLIAFRATVTASPVVASSSAAAESHVSPTAQTIPLKPVKAVVHRRANAVTLAKSTNPSPIPQQQAPDRRADIAASAAADRDAELVLQTPPLLIPAMFSDAPAIETVFVLVEHRRIGTEGQPMVQIQVWRMTVLRQAIPSGTRAVPVPHKET